MSLINHQALTIIEETSLAALSFSCTHCLLSNFMTMLLPPPFQLHIPVEPALLLCRSCAGKVFVGTLSMIQTG